MNTEVGEPKEKNYFLVKKQSQNEKLFIAAAVIVMAGSMASCGQKTQKAAQDTAATEPVATEQVEAVEIEAVTPESEIPAAAESQKTQPEQANNK